MGGKTWFWPITNSEGSDRSKAILCACGATLGLCATAFAAYKLYRHFYPTIDKIDEGFVDEARLEVSSQKKVLVVGLDGAGKTSILSRFNREDDSKSDSKPTEGFWVISVSRGDVEMDLWELGGSATVRPYWTKFAQDTDVLVFVVDASDPDRIPEAHSELHRLFGDERLTHVPILVLANKQDVEGAVLPMDVLHQLGLEGLSSKERVVEVLPTQICPPPAPRQDGVVLRHPSISDAEHTLISWCRQKKRHFTG